MKINDKGEYKTTKVKINCYYHKGEYQNIKGVVCSAFVERALGYTPGSVSIEAFMAEPMYDRGCVPFTVKWSERYNTYYLANEENTKGFDLLRWHWKALGSPRDGDTVYIKVRDKGEGKHGNC